MIDWIFQISRTRNIQWKDIIQHVFLPSPGASLNSYFMELVDILFLYRYCSIVHPSWAELAQFVRFLHVQLNDCQHSIYCNQNFFGGGTDFKTFVVEFMIRMSQVCYLLTYVWTSIHYVVLLVYICMYVFVPLLHTPGMQMAYRDY